MWAIFQAGCLVEKTLIRRLQTCGPGEQKHGTMENLQDPVDCKRPRENITSSSSER